MKNNGNLIILDKKVADRPIRLPEWTFFTALKDFGGAEGLAGLFDIVMTILVNSLLPPEAWWRIIVLPLVGPVFEKFLFYVYHGIKAVGVYRSTLERVRRPYKHYFRQALRDGSETLIKDLLIHDPCYIAIMAFGVGLTTTPPWALSIISYALAIFVVAWIDVGKAETLFRRKKNALQRIGFSHEAYWESRFVVQSGYDKEEIMQQYCRDFGLRATSPVEYTDVYYATSLPAYGNRTAKIRYRRRQRRADEQDDQMWGPDKEQVATFQVLYTKAKEENSKLDQVRYYPTKKEKLWINSGAMTDEPLPLEEIDHEKLRKFLQDATGDKRLIGFTFTREVCHDQELAVCFDTVPIERDYAIIEIKTYKDKIRHKKAIRYLFNNCAVAVLQTTLGKSDFIDLKC